MSGLDAGLEADQGPEGPNEDAQIADLGQNQDICRVCRCEASQDRPLFHPCICTGSIKYIHQECLLQWLRYSKKEFCELCNHRFSFTPIYSPDMPKRIPLSVVFSGFLGTVAHAVRFWLHYTLVALAWLGVVPLTACRIYRTLFTGSVSNILSIPSNVFSTENITSDILQGCAVVTLTLVGLFGLVWLREQILHGGGPEWLDVELNDPPVQQQQQEQQPQEQMQHQLLLQEQEIDDIPLEENVNQNVLEQNEERMGENLPAEPPEPEANPAELPPPGDELGAENENNPDNLGDDGQWNPMEWDRPAEEMPWERLLGLDGSLVFLEHVSYAVALNTLFILVFAFCPYYFGHFTIIGFRLNHFTDGAQFEGMLTTLCGYCVIGLGLLCLHTNSSLLGFKWFARITGICYVVVKVALLLVVEVVAFPVICGWWLDICSLNLFDATLKDRQSSYNAAPMASIFLHWLIGMVYIFYFFSFDILLREVLRPGVVWFVRNLNDPDFNPVQEMIHLSIPKHMSRFCGSLVLFGTSILVMLFIPAKIIKKAFPTFLPYQTAPSGEGQVDELAMELLLLLVILPAVQDQNHTREWLKTVIRSWCSVAAYLLGIKSYLFGDVELEQENHPNQPENNEVQVAVNANGADAPRRPAGVHQALLQHEASTGAQAYYRPPLFPLRIAGLLCMMFVSWLMASLTTMLVPVWLGRRIFSLCLSDNSRVYELYTSSIGLYFCFLVIKLITLVAGWIQQGWAQMSQKMKEWAVLAFRASAALFLLVGVIPLLFGVLLEVVVLTPVRVSVVQSPVYFPWQDWALGAMYTKITIALTFMGPDWWLKAAIEQLYQDGIRGLDFSFLIPKLVAPVCATLGLALALPYLAANSLAKLIISDEDTLNVIHRRIYPFLLVVITVVCLVLVQLRQFRKLYEHIKNDRYLVGRRLVNYNHPSNTDLHSN